MRIKEVTALKATIPFAREFSHSLRKRLSITNVFILLKDKHGKILGCGEGAPRSYVTGETPDTMISCISSLVRDDSFPWELNNIQELWKYLDSLPVQKAMNASICAIDMALSDALARDQKKKITDFYSHKNYSSPVKYSAPIPLGTENLVKNACQTINSFGMKRLKLKMGKDYSQNESLLKIISDNIPDRSDLKVDVNGVWDKETGIKHLPLLSEYGVKVIEQPAAPGSNDNFELNKAAGDFNITIMADEAACTFEDIKKIAYYRHYGMINVRVSKCGGLRRSLKIVDFLRSEDIPFQIGCQLGESGLLSAAGRALSLLCGDAVSYEGSYDSLLLSENITTEDVTFEYGGKGHPLEGTGLGINVDPVRIKKLADHSSVITIQMS